jgi:hypothetical protein
MAVWQTYWDRAGAPLSIPVLEAPGTTGAANGAPGWPVGHVLDFLVVPAEAATSHTQDGPDSLALQSFRPAWSSAYTLLQAHPLPPRPAAPADPVAGYGLAVVDYPGGAAVHGPLQGSSAGLALATGLVAPRAALDWPRGRYATAALDNGRLVCLGVPPSLQAKGAAVALLPGAPQRLVVVTNATDGAGIEAGARAYAPSPGITVRAVPVDSLGSAIAVLLEDPYAGYFDRLAEAGREAAMALDLPLPGSGEI